MLAAATITGLATAAGAATARTGHEQHMTDSGRRDGDRHKDSHSDGQRDRKDERGQHRNDARHDGRDH